MRPDGSYVSATNPAQRGETITVFATGLGQTSPPTTTGTPGVAGQSVSNTLLATLNQRSAAVLSAAYEPETRSYPVVPHSALPGAGKRHTIGELSRRTPTWPTPMP